MELLRPEQYEEAERFLSGHENSHFMQSVQWAALKEGWKSEIVVSRSGEGSIVGGMVVLIRRVPVLGYSLLYAPRGPVCDYQDRTVLRDLLEGVKALAKKYRAFLFKMDPCIPEGDEETIRRLRSLGFSLERGRRDFETIQSRFNYILPDLAGKTEEEVLMGFSSKTRYNIRLAQRHGVECRLCDASCLPEFCRLMEETARRDHFIPRPMAYFSRLMEVFGENARLYLCYYQGRAVSGAICVQYGSKMWYLYGASDHEARQVMPSSLMQWEMICRALTDRCSSYDFMGIPVNADPKSPMYGLYRFKKGFQGEIAGYAGEFDYVFRPWLNRRFICLQEKKRRLEQHRLRRRADHQ